MRRNLTLCCIVAFAFCMCPVGLSAQQVTVATPHTAISDSFFEHTGTSWGARGDNWFFQFGPPGNPNSAAPGFGGFDPSAGANLGFGFGGGGWNGNFLGNFSQGSRRSFTSTTPSVTLQNGVPGGVFDSSLSPFVVGHIPVVGGFPVVAPPMQPMMMPPAPYVPPGPAPGHPGVMQALQNIPDEPAPPKLAAVGDHVPEGPLDDFNLVGPNQPASVAPAAQPGGSPSSTAGRPAPSVAEARRMHEAEAAQQDHEAQTFVERGRTAKNNGKPRLARMYYQMALRRASTDLQQDILALLAALPDADREPR